MKKSFFRRLMVSVVAVAAMTIGCGCRSYIEVNGRSCAMLTEREVRELVLLARETMAKNSPRHATSDEVAVMRRTEPEVKIEYYGSCLGEAVIRWELADRKIEVVYEGLLNSNDPRERDMMLRVVKKHPAVLDFRPGRGQGSAAPRQP